jgi:DNA mismatch repair protein MutL
VRFTVLSDGRQAFTSSGDGTLFSALVAVCGLAVANKMVPLPAGGDPAVLEAGEYAGAHDPSPGRPRVTGYVSRPSCYKSTRQHLSFFVNQRWVQSRALSFAVEDAYHSLLLAGRHPIAALNIALDPALLDVNVHPAKTEVRFLHERQVYAAVQRAVREAVLATAETPEIAASSFVVPAWESTGVDGARGDQQAGTDAARDEAQTLRTQLWAGSDWGATTDGPGEDEAPGRQATRQGFEVPGVDASAPVGGTKLPVLRVLGQVSQSYIITEGPDGVYLVDQHAAHERIVLERMITEWRTRTVSSQLLLQPVPIELVPAEREAVEAHVEALRAIGFEIEPFGMDAMLVRALPAALASMARQQPLRELLVDLAGAEEEAASHGETWEEHALANVACKAAIKAGQTLSPEEQRELIRQLEGVSAHQSCCHGRPTMVHLSLSALEQQFDRR